MPTNVSNAALAPSLIASRGTTAIGEAAIVLLASLALAVSAHVSVPFYPVPLTLQTLAVMAIAAAFGARLGTLSVLAYLAEGLAGLPVFAKFAAGPLYLLGPTGGFLVGFILLAVIVGAAADRGWDRSPVKLFATLVVADALLFVLGFVWLAWFAHLSSGHGLGAMKAWAGGVAPFVLGDLLKSVLVAAGVPAVRGVIDAFRV
jgi:biotin transport system substrate-specific component